MKTKYLEFTTEFPANRETLTELLNHNVCVVKFTKVNGEIREMPCTLSADHLPARDLKESRIRREPETSLSVWCTDQNAWRSFRLDNVISIRVE